MLEVKMAANGVVGSVSEQPDYSTPTSDGSNRVKVICLGDSAVGKSKLVERFLMDGYQPHQLSTYALTLFRYTTDVDGESVVVDFWDTAGQERFSSMHPSYYHQAHACILVFDVTRKITYKNLPNWYKELREYRPEIPCLCAANKIDVDIKVTKKSFNFSKKFGMPFYYVSASDGTNVVKMFQEAIRCAVQYKKNPTDFIDEVMQELEYKFSAHGKTMANLDKFLIAFVAQLERHKNFDSQQEMSQKNFESSEFDQENEASQPGNQ